MLVLCRYVYIDWHSGPFPGFISHDLVITGSADGSGKDVDKTFGVGKITTKSGLYHHSR